MILNNTVNPGYKARAYIISKLFLGVEGIITWGPIHRGLKTGRTFASEKINTFKYIILL